ncbi:MAG: 30S ribosomal protein S7 [Nitrospinae bacterium]|nr:30S ribosomal protein S7 [Nitrospinota bacterium]
MPRRHVTLQKASLKNVRIDDPLTTRFINIVMKRGKKSVAERMLRDTMGIVRAKTGAEPAEVFRRAIDNTKPSLEVKSRRVGGSTYQIPVEVPHDRRVALSMRWLIDSARARGERGFPARLAAELMDAANNTGAACKKREDTHKMAEANKAFAHYKW